MFGELGPKIQILQNFLTRMGYFSDLVNRNLFISQGGNAIPPTSVGVDNTYVGNITGNPSGNTSGNLSKENTAIGSACLSSNTTGGQNTAVGAYAMTKNTTGFLNTVIGRDAGQNMTTGGLNVIIGGNAGAVVTTDSNNVAIGYSADFNSGPITNRISIGYLSNCTADNTAQIGNSAITQLAIGTSNTASVKALNTIKAYGKVTGATGARVLNDGFNVSSITDTAAGDITYNFTTSFADANYTAGGLAESQVNAGAIANRRTLDVFNGGQATGSCRIQCWDNTATTDLLKDPTAWHLTFTGKQ